MTGVEITVRGSHAVRVPPEQATVYAAVTAQGPAPQPVHDAVAGALAAVTGTLDTRHDPADGPVTSFAVEQVRRGSHRPYTADGRQLAPVHTAAASITATFTDFEELAAWVGETAGVSGLAVNHIDWSLTDPTRLAAERSTRQEAVRDACRRAQDYADALDLGPVSVRRVSDPGMGGPVMPKVMMARATADGAGGPPEIALRPDDVEIEAQVEATFVVNIKNL